MQLELAMTHHFHAVVWIDHRQAYVYEFGTEGVNEQHIKSPDHEGHIHHKAGTVGSGHSHDAKAYLTAIANAVRDNQEILIVGDGGAKTELAHFIRDHVPVLAPRIMGVEAMDQCSKGQIVAFARKFFEQKDHSTPQL
jgi:stalled ribosome rescue protein Dom34